MTILDEARRIAPQITSLGAEADSLRRLPDALVAAMRAAGLFSIFTPRSLGGAELGWRKALAVIEEVSAADASAGWCLVKGAGSNLLSGAVPAAQASAIWTAPDLVIAGSLNPKGRALPASGGWTVSGRWDWGTATSFADIIMAGALLCDQLGAPTGQARIFLMEPDRLRLHPGSWDTMGMRGTGSVDFEGQNVFVPHERTIDLAALMPQEAGELYRVPFFASAPLPHAALAIGIARGAIEDLKMLASAKTPLMSKALLKDKEWVQEAVAQAQAAVNSSRAYVYAAIDEVLETQMDPSAQAMVLSLAAPDATHRCLDAVTLMQRAAGGSAVHVANPIQRRFRDLHVAASHFLVNREKYAAAGLALLAA